MRGVDMMTVKNTSEKSVARIHVGNNESLRNKHFSRSQEKWLQSGALEDGERKSHDA